MARSAITRALDFVYAMTWHVRFRIHDDEISKEGLVLFEDERCELYVWWDRDVGTTLMITVNRKVNGRSVWAGDVIIGEATKRGGDDVLEPIRTRRSARRAIEALLNLGGKEDEAV